jgi:predicted nucleic acid-binding protein
MTARVFVDTNVLVYARDLTDAHKHERSLAWVAALWQERAGRLSWQVLHEYYVTVTRKLDPPRASVDARDDVTSLVTWRPIPLDLLTIDSAWDAEDRFGLSWWDSLIVAAAWRGECTHLLTEDLQSGRKLDGLTIISPLAHTPDEILEP